MSVQQRLRNRWQGPTAALLIALLAAAAVLLFARAHADLQAEQEVRAATANAAAPVGDAMRKAMSDSAAGTVAVQAGRSR